MNKYLEKIAGLEPIRKDTAIGRVKEQAPITAPGSKLTHGAKTLFSRAMLKAAEEKSSWKQEAISTGTIAASGVASGGIAHKILNWGKPKVKGEGLKAMALTGGLGLLGDYAAVKLNKQINKHVQ